MEGGVMDEREEEFSSMAGLVTALLIAGAELAAIVILWR